MLRKSLAALGLGALLIAGGCDLRIDTGTPDAQEPDAQELARREAISAATSIQKQASQVARQVDNGELTLPEAAETEQLSALLAAIDKQTVKQLQLLGPEVPAANSNESEEPDGSAEESGTAGSSGLETVTLRKLRSTIEASAIQLIDNLETIEPELARLTGSISASLLMWHTELTAVTSDPATNSETDATAVAPELDIPGVLDISAPDPQWVPLVRNWDQIAYLLEIAAARGGDSRESLSAAASEYRERAQEWAQALGVAGGDSDPRLASYATPPLTGDFSADVLALQEEVRVVLIETNYQIGDLIYSLPAAQRATAVVELANIAADNQRWGVPAALLPGLREQGEPLALD